MEDRRNGGRMLLQMELSLRRDARYVGMMRDIARCVLADLGAPSEARDDIEIVVTEACANAVRHAAGTADYHVGLLVTLDGCEVEVSDLGPGFEAELLERARAGDEQDESGRGLTLIQALVDDLELLPQDHGTRLRLQKSWTGLDLAPDQAATGGGW